MIPKVQQQAVNPGTLEWSDLQGLVLEGSAEFRESALALVELWGAELQALGLELPALELPAQGAGAEGSGAWLRLHEDASVLHAEGYVCEVEATGVSLRASTAQGLFYASRTLLVALGGGGALGLGRISDEPRYAWRGVHLDVARHFYPVSFIKRFIDLLALHKLNVFHWHLTEDQGWRIQVDAYPRLSEVAAWRAGKQGRYGGCYSKQEVREVVAYAAARHVVVVPEIEMPGHALAALAAYPELSCTGGPFEVATDWGIFDDVFCLGQDNTLQFLERVVDEVLELFPGKYFHIGADECPKVRWRACSRCQARMQAEGLASEEQLQSWFVSRMSRYLEARGKQLVGWDEILEGGLAPGATVMSWRGTAGGLRAAQMGHDVVMSPTSHCYLDYKQVADREEPGAWFAPALTLETVYSYEPTPAELSPAEQAHVLGVQANIWSERMPTEAQVEYMTFPRLCALSEVAWSGPGRDFADFERRLEQHLRVLDRHDVAYRGSERAKPLEPSAEEQAQYSRAEAERGLAEPTALAYG